MHAQVCDGGETFFAYVGWEIALGYAAGTWLRSDGIGWEPETLWRDWWDGLPRRSHW